MRGVVISINYNGIGVGLDGGLDEGHLEAATVSAFPLDTNDLTKSDSGARAEPH